MRYKFICEYNGFAFSGWQEQLKNSIVCEKTVQTELERAFSIALRQKISIVGAGRTDAGVHARGQVAHFDFEGEALNCHTLEKSVNAISDKNVCIRNLEPCSKDFHARYSAKERCYQYTLCTEQIVLGRELVWVCGYKLDTELMEQEAKFFLGEHDFNAFSIPRNDGKSTICTITEFRLEKPVGMALRWHICGNRFLHKQIRSMVGLLFDVGRGRFAPGTAEKIFSGEFKGERTWAPPQGLVLEEVRY
ncbi:MAG: tRNA pseudouridine(38-40) synthase TruA [Fibromonadaceae bacterium]|jgi:tRNA pseudouridine38-40 synthase|nr:tRNA pseudouridine(38-40) synthase TruA [Fibromonadaceae bacterium]